MKKVKILGTGCMKCNQLSDLVEQAVSELGEDFEIEKVTDLNKIMDYGVALTPALVVDEEVKFAGKLPKNIEEVKKYLT